MRFVNSLLIAIFTASLLISPLFGEETKGPQVGDKIEPFETTTIDGNTLKLEWYAGMPIIIDMWATWCPPCKQELPALQELAYEFPMEFFVLAVSIDPEKDKEIVQKFLEENKIDMTVVHDADHAILDKFPTDYIPSLTVIGKDGNVLKKFEGYDQDLIPQLKELLGLKPPSSSKEYAERGYKLYDYMSNYEKALADFDKAIEMDPINSIARCGRGEVLVDMGKKDEGIKDLLRAIELSNTNSRAYMNLGYLEEGARNYEKALEWYTIGAENSPEDERLVNYRDQLANKVEILNTPAPDFTVKTLTGEEITLSALKGNKAVIIDSWATWCGPCRLEMPKLQEFYNKYSDKVEIIAVSNEKELQTITDFIAKEGFTFKIVQDADGVVKEKYPSKYIPFLTIISKDGLIIETFTGYNENVIEELEGLLEL